jgi:DUF2971 family protein
MSRELPDETRLLYHYTGVTGLRGIVDSGRVWATSIHYLNDRRELQHALDLTRNSMARLLSEASGTRAVVLKAMEDELSRINLINMFVFSLSEQRDLLSQWRAYCPSGGYALGFVTQRLREVAYEQGFVLAPCVYDRGGQMEAIARCIEEHRSATMMRAEASAQRGDDLLRIGYEFGIRVLQVAPLLKDPSFVEEREWRLVSAPIPSTDPRIRFRERGSILVPYVELQVEVPEDGGDRATLKEVMIGPMRDAFHAGHSLGSFLQSCGIRKYVIRNSEIPYRSW